MPIMLCPNCHKRVYYKSYDVDVVHRCDTNKDVLDKESIVNIGDYSDWEGTGDAQTGKIKNWNLQGLKNELFGTIADVEGETYEEVNEWGKRKSTHRTRKRFTYVVTKPVRS